MDVCFSLSFSIEKLIKYASKDTFGFYLVSELFYHDYCQGFRQVRFVNENCAVLCTPNIVKAAELPCCPYLASMFLAHISDHRDSISLCRFVKIFAHYAVPTN